MLNTAHTRNAHSPARLRFAREVVVRAGIVDEVVAANLVQAFAAVPREQFVGGAFLPRALQDVALPIGYGQTISRPSTVARMLGLLGVGKGMRVLEVGCGSGYCSAVMAELGATVFAIEYVGMLAQQTRHKLDALGYHNIIIKRGDGRRGWAEHAPYDAIVMSAAFDEVDKAILDQLVRPGGRLVAPVGNKDGQILHLWEAKQREVVCYRLEACSFVEGQAFDPAARRA